MRFNREAKAAAPINVHENVVTIHKVSPADARENSRIWRCSSSAASTLNEKIDKVGQVLGVTEILRIGMQIADGLAAAHKQGLVHRDIKPSNILLENGVERVKITDFGLARAADDASVTQSGTVAGTPMYMSPEQANGEPIDFRSDLFSLGSVLYVMCTGKAPFRATSTMAVLKRVCEETPRPMLESNPEIPEWLCDIVTKLHAKKREDRFEIAKEVADLLGHHLAELQAGRAANVGHRSADATEPGNSRPPAAHAPGSPKLAAWPWLVLAAVILASILRALDPSHLHGRPPLASSFCVCPSIVDDPGLPGPNTKNGDKPIVPIADNDGWVQLFNGKDLVSRLEEASAELLWLDRRRTGAHRRPRPLKAPLQGRAAAISRTSTCRWQEVKMNAACDGGIIFGMPFTLEDKARSGVYMAQLGLPFSPTGSLYRCSPLVKINLFNEKLHKADEWFRFEIIVQGSHIKVLVNDQVTKRFR